MKRTGSSHREWSLLDRFVVVCLSVVGFCVLATAVLWLPFFLLLVWPFVLVTAFNLIVTALLSTALVYRLDPALLQRFLPESLFLLILWLAESWSSISRETKRIRQNRKTRRSTARRGTPSSSRLPQRTEEIVAVVDSVQALRTLEKYGDYERLIPALRRLLRKDKGLYSQPWVTNFIGKRWRYHFLTEASTDPQAITTARSANRPWKTVFLGSKDERSDVECLAARFLLGSGRGDWAMVLGDEETVAMPKFVLPDSEYRTVGLLFVPGLLNGLLPVRAFSPALAACEKRFGISVLRADCHPLRGCKANSCDIMQAIRHSRGLRADTTVSVGVDDLKPFEKFVAMGYSKGVPDMLTALVEEEEFRSRCVGLISWGGAVQGSYLADEGYQNVPVNDIDSLFKGFNPLFSPLLTRKIRVSETNISDACRDLTSHARENFNLQNHDLFDSMDIPVLCFTGSCQASEVPYFQIQSSLKLRRIDANNDMQLTEPQTLLNTATATQVARLNGNHWDISYGKFPPGLNLGSRKLEHPFPKEAALAANLMLAMELGILTSEEY